MATIIQRTADRVKIRLTTTERQIIFDRTGLEPSKTLWVNADLAVQEWHVAVYGRSPEPSCPHAVRIGADGAPRL